MKLLNPKKITKTWSDPKRKEIMEKTIAWFEKKGLKKILEDDNKVTWYQDFIDFCKKEQIYAQLFTPTAYGDGKTRWDTSQITEFAEILGFYGLGYWYTFQVSALGLGPVFIGKNEEVKRKTAQLLKDGAIFAFGLSEKEHGADIYSSEMKLYPKGDGTYLARGSKYYIGNGNEAGLVSVFGKIADTDEYVFFTVNSKHEKYELVKNTINSQCYVAEFALNDYPITEADITDRGQEAWDASLNTINIMKFNLGWGSIGIATHSFYESINHAANRKLFGSYVTEFTHIKQLFVDSFCRIAAMKLFALRATDYMRCASKTDRRYLLFNPMVKMKVTTQGEEVINMLWDIIAARGFEKDTYFSISTRDIRALPKLEGTVHVNMALIIKFMANYFFKPGKFPEVPCMADVNQNDDFLFNQGATKGLSRIQFHDYKPVYKSVNLPNVKVFRKQISKLKRLLMLARPTKAQANDIDFLLILGELFTLVAYGQLILENKKIYKVDDDIIDQIFDFMVRDFSKFALQLYSKPAATAMQRRILKSMIEKPVFNKRRYERVLNEFVYSNKGVYVMND